MQHSSSFFSANLILNWLFVPLDVLIGEDKQSTHEPNLADQLRDALREGPGGANSILQVCIMDRIHRAEGSHCLAFQGENEDGPKRLDHWCG